ncbi:MAG: hypothetical protein HYZ25_05780 [Chloroflexi bacterium]|nr:hypothetical protein [Chloroflexota bacterium]
MDNLPIPQLRSSWSAALVHLITVFLLYYLLMFDYLLGLYGEQFVNIPFEKEHSLQVWARVPRYSYSSGPSSLFIHAQNESDKTLNDVEIFLITTTPSNNPPLLLPNLYDNKVYVSGVEFPAIEPHSIATGRMSFIAQTKTRVTGIILRIGGVEEVSLNAKKTFFIEESNPKSLQHSFLEIILLPPWSNGFILALVLLSTFLIHNKMEEEEENKIFSSGWWTQFGHDYWASLILLVVMFFATASVYALLGIINLMTALPLLGLIAFIWLIAREDSNKLGIFVRFKIRKEFNKVDAQKIIVQSIVFFGFFFMMFGFALAFFVPQSLIPTAARVFWGFLGGIGFLAFYWFYDPSKKMESAKKFAQRIEAIAESIGTFPYKKDDEVADNVSNEPTNRE